MVTITDGEKKMVISIDSYQYSDKKSKEGKFDYDANWLDVAVTYFNGSDVFRDVDPCLLTTELNEIVDNLEKIISKEEESYISDFLEPYLRIVFARDGERIATVVHFVYCTNGPWKAWKITQFLSADEADELLCGLKAMYAKFPRR